MESRHRRPGRAEQPCGFGTLSARAKNRLEITGGPLVSGDWVGPGLRWGQDTPPTFERILQP